MDDTLIVEQGLGSKWTLQLRDSTSAPYTQYTGSEALAATVRTGQDQPALFSLTPVWFVAAAGTITLQVPGSVSVGLAVGRYLLQVTLADGSADLLELWFEVAYSPGTAAALSTYASFQEMLDRAPWIEKLERPTDLAGFAKQRYQARLWFEDLLHRHHRPGTGPFAGFGFLPVFGRRYGLGGAWGFRDGRRSVHLQSYLDAGGLAVTLPVIEAVSCYAIALICERQIVPGKDDGGYAAFARKYFARAEDAATGITAEIDSDADGNTDFVIRLGVADTLEG